MFTHIVLWSSTHNICRDAIYSVYFDYTKDTSSLPLIDAYKYPKAALGARNEVWLLKYIYNHPDVHNAKNISGQSYNIDGGLIPS